MTRPPYHYGTTSTWSSTKPPLGIMIICFLGVIGSFFGFAVIAKLTAAGGAAAVLGYVLLGLLLASFVIYYGLLTLKSWAWPWAVLYYVVGAFLALVTLNLVSVLIQGFIIYYLFQVEDQYW